jgi:hypothetical protein
LFHNNQVKIADLGFSKAIEEAEKLKISLKEIKIEDDNISNCSPNDSPNKEYRFIKN